MDINNSIKKMLGSSRPSHKNDWDGDGVSNKKDCQPRNPMRQDSGWWDRGHKVNIEESMINTDPIWVSYRLYVDGVHIAGASGQDTVESLNKAERTLRDKARAHITKLKSGKG